MKKLITGILILGLLSFTTYETLSNRSTSQVVIYGSEIPTIKQQIITYYKLGFRVIFMESQSVTTSYNAFYGERIKGDFLIIMEK